MANTINPATGASGANIYPLAPEQSGLSKLFQNKLFLQFLAGAGADIASGNPIGANVNAVTNQSIANQNYAKLLQKMLAGEVPEGGKVTMDNKGLKLDVPSSALGTNKMTGLDITGASAPNTLPATPNINTQQNLGMLSLLNPSSSPLGNLSPADLAGLTPEMLSSAVSIKQSQESQQQNQMLNLIKLGQSQQQLDLDQQQVNISAWKALNADDRTAAIQNYEYYVNQQKALELEAKDFATWDKDTRTKFEKEYDRAYAEDNTIGSFHKWIRDLTALSGGLDLYKEKLAAADVQENKNYFAKDLPKDIDKYLSSDEVQNDLIKLEGATNVNRAKAEKTISYIEQQVVSKGATIKDVKRSGDTFIWTISWPDGTTQEVKRIIKLGAK